MKIKDLFPTGRTLGVPIGSKRLFFDPTAMIAAAAGTTNAIIGAAGSMYGNNAAVQDSDASRYYDLQKSVLQRNWYQQDQALALQEAQRSREYSTNERKAEQSFIAHQNSVANQVAQMIANGVNPAQVFGQAGSGGQIGSAPSAPSLATAALSGSPITGAGVQSFSRSAAIRDMASALQALNSSGSEVVKSMSSARKIESEVNLLIKQAQTEEQKAAYQKALAWSTNEKLPHEVRQICENINLMLSQGKVVEADAQLKHMQKTYTSTQNDYLSKQLPFIAEDMQAAIDLKKEQQETERAKQSHERASASHESEQAKTESETRKPRVRMLRAQATIEEAREDVEANPTVIAEKLELVRKTLQRDMFESDADYQEALRRLDHAKSTLNMRETSRAHKLFDDVMMYVGDQIGNALRVLK